MREGQVGLLGAVAAVIMGALLIYAANNTLSANTPGQALIAYVGVFIIVAGMIYGVMTLLDRKH